MGERRGESSRVRALVGKEGGGWVEGGIKAGGPDRLEQESKEKYLIGIKCPDSAWATEFRKACCFSTCEKKKE